MKQIFLSVAALTLIVFTGVIHGHWTHRWQLSKELAAAAAKVTAVQETIGHELGDWQADIDKIPDRQLRIAGIVRYFAARYQVSGGPIAILLVCGEPGPISVHLPQMCYVSAGFEMTGKRKQFVLNHEDGTRWAEFRKANFTKDEPAGQTLRIYWTFGAGGTWTAPDTDDPRFAFAGHPVIYKLYVIHDISGGENEETVQEFMRKLMAELDVVLFKTTAPSAHASRDETGD